MQQYSKMFDILTNSSSSSHTQQQNQQILKQMYDFVQSIQQTSKLQQLIKTNYFCMISIFNEFKLSQVIQVINSCLTDLNQIMKQHKNSQTYRNQRLVLLISRLNLFLAVDKYQPHIEPKQHKSYLQNTISQHLGEYHILKTNIQNREQSKYLIINYQLILTYIFKKLQQFQAQIGNQQQSSLYKKASNRILKRSQSQILRSIQLEIEQTQESEKKNRQKEDINFNDISNINSMKDNSEISSMNFLKIPKQSKKVKQKSTMLKKKTSFKSNNSNRKQNLLKL